MRVFWWETTIIQYSFVAFTNTRLYGKSFMGQSGWKGRRAKKLVLSYTELARDYLLLRFIGLAKKFGFFPSDYGKTRKNFLANPIFRLIKLAKSSKASSTHTLHRIQKTSIIHIK